MKTLLQFFLRYSVFFLFLALEIVAFIMLSNHNLYQRSVVLSSCNRVTASLYEAETAVVDYFRLRQDNNLLEAENAELRNRINELENQIENAGIAASDYIAADKDLQYVDARVVNLSTNQQRNYLTLNKGSRDGIKPNMGVRCKEGVVGIVDVVSERFAVVVPILNPGISISCRLTKNDYVGSLMWEGRDYRYANLKDIARHIDIQEGDTLVTSGLSAIFPPNIPVGIVEQTKLTEGDAYYTVKVRLFTDFRRLHSTQVILNHNAEEEEALETSVSNNEK